MIEHTFDAATAEKIPCALNRRLAATPRSALRILRWIVSHFRAKTPCFPASSLKPRAPRLEKTIENT
jgi:hypothetical protein